MINIDLATILQGDTGALSEAINAVASSTQKSAAQLRHELAQACWQEGAPEALFDAPLAQQLAQFAPAFIAQIAADDDFYSQPHTPLRALLEQLLPIASHWFAQDSKPSQQFFDKLIELLQRCANQPSEIASARREFNLWFDSETKRASLLESRLRETELSNAKLALAQTRVIKLINQHLAQRPLPLELHSLIAQSLKSELQYWAFTSPESELDKLPLWLQWQRILGGLGKVFSLASQPVDDQLLYSQIPALLAELERSASLNSSNPPVYQQLITQVNHCLMAAVQKAPLENAVFAALALPEGCVASNTKVPLSLLQATEKIALGSWVIMRTEAQTELRCKLILRDPDLDQLLFVDHTGRKVMSKSNKEFALCLSTGIAQALPTLQLTEVIQARLHSLVASAKQHLEEQLRKKKQKAEALVRAFKAEQQAQAEAAERARQAQQKRMQAELDARQAAAHKAMAEARLLADAQRQRQAAQAEELRQAQLQQAQAEAAEAQARAQQALATANSLQVGAWLDMNIDNQPTRAKLSVIIAATGKYIFADQVGRKVGEFNREQLIALLSQGEIKVLRNGDNFEEQLAKVIRGLRRDVN